MDYFEGSNMKKLQSFALACAGLISIISFSTASYATPYYGSRGGAFTFTVGGGYDFLSSKRNMENATVPFAGFGFDFTNHWGIEGILGAFTANFDNSVNDNREISGTMFAVDGVYHFSPYKIVEPYVLAGVGIMGLSPNRYDANNEGNINGAVGVQFFIDPLVAFRVEARDFYTMVGGKNDVYLNAGITFYWDTCCVKTSC